MNRIVLVTGIFVYGHSLDKEGSITKSTKKRVNKAVLLHLKRYDQHSCVVSAAGFSPDVPSQVTPMHRQIANYALSLGASCVGELPARTFDTNGDVLVEYVPVWDIPAPRSFALECAKFVTVLLPVPVQERLRLFAKSKMRTSW
jgi:hypothetical protein